MSPTLPSVAPVDNTAADVVPFNKFFVAWSQTYAPGPIQTQVFEVDTRQDRQYAAFEVHENVKAFAKANPGRLYINGDEPDQYCIEPSLYADVYHDFVIAVRSADPTARVSPAGFAEPNERCCPDPADAGCRERRHSLNYANEFYNAYVQRYNVPPPVNEWRFHDFGLSYAVGDINGWWARIDKYAAWSVAHGANMVLGAWGFLGWQESVPAYQEHMKQAMGRLLTDDRINGAAYWSYQPWVDSPRYLTIDGSLTAEGQTFVNPLTDIPTGVKIVGSANGHAKLRWSNTTSAWASEVEFWVQSPGSESFVLQKRELVASLGANQTPSVVVNAAGNVKARVRYYNDYGQAAWSSFSNTVPLGLTEAQGDQRKVFRNNPHFCFLKFC